MSTGVINFFSQQKMLCRLRLKDSCICILAVYTHRLSNKTTLYFLFCINLLRLLEVYLFYFLSGDDLMMNGLSSREESIEKITHLFIPTVTVSQSE